MQRRSSGHLDLQQCNAGLQDTSTSNNATQVFSYISASNNATQVFRDKEEVISACLQQCNAGLQDISASNNATQVFRTSRPPTMQRRSSGHLGLQQCNAGLQGQSFIQSPLWNGKTTYPANMNAWKSWSISSNLVVMLSFIDMELLGNFQYGCKTEYVNLFIDKIHIWTACDVSYPKPDIYAGNVFSIQFHSGVQSLRKDLPTGFRLHFSIHNNSARQAKLPNGLWNCSVPFWKDFQRHLDCNLELECADGRDEAACSYTSDICPQGTFRASNSCFVHVIPRRTITRNDAKKDCHRRGGSLASLSTPEVWSDVVWILRRQWVAHTLVGLKMTSFTLPEVYQNVFQWFDGCIAYNMRTSLHQDESGCGLLFVNSNVIILLSQVKCDGSLHTTFLCQLDKVEAETSNTNVGTLNSINKLFLENWTYGVSVTECPAGHVTHAFLACDKASYCWSSKASDSRSCSPPLTPLPPSFVCNNGVQQVPYSLVCDYRADCGDQSDEDFCHFPACQRSDFQCGGKQCIPETQVCDQIKQCVNGIDEAECRRWRPVNLISPPAPAIVNFASDRYLNFTAFRTSSSPFPGCPDSHFQCPPDGYCLPVFVRCNGVSDCQDRADEMGCEQYTCPGFYRCRSSKVCLHPDHLCDGVSHCPQRDDELFCHQRCPPNCICYGRAFFCSGFFVAGSKRRNIILW
ncbi:hypothetical protein ACOMHN_020450 [Nucella lapillus]